MKLSPETCAAAAMHVFLRCHGRSHDAPHHQRVSRRKIMRPPLHVPTAAAILRCRYCGVRSNLTIDHVRPTSKGGDWSWENLVTACVKCNGKKGDSTLKQLGWKLKKQPQACLAARPLLHACTLPTSWPVAYDASSTCLHDTRPLHSFLCTCVRCSGYQGRAYATTGHRRAHGRPCPERSFRSSS